jgi:hypothetical protein
MDLGTMYLRGFVHGVVMGSGQTTETVLAKLLGGMLCEMHERRARGMALALGAAKA